jgi:ABC-type Fe3+/spermidine/putrescine transport system ATPase subunit
LRARGIGRREADKRSIEVLDTMGMGSLIDRNVLLLSGGERQRVALARSLVYRPKLLLLDEPLSALDPSLREDLRKDVKRILRASGMTTLYVTHDRTEALSISDRVHIMDEGRIAESGEPRKIYQRPKTVRGAAFMGITTPIPILSRTAGSIATPFGPVRTEEEGSGPLGYRPENVVWSDPGNAIEVRGKVEVCDFRGRDYSIEVRTENGSFAASSKVSIPLGGPISFFIKEDELFFLK